jgi:hypothetical protein
MRCMAKECFDGFRTHLRKKHVALRRELHGTDRTPKRPRGFNAFLCRAVARNEERYYDKPRRLSIPMNDNCLLREALARSTWCGFVYQGRILLTMRSWPEQPQLQPHTVA